MKNKAHRFSIRANVSELPFARSLPEHVGIGQRTKNGRLFNQFVAGLLCATLAVITTWWEWHHQDPCIGLIFVREKNLTVSNVRQLLAGLGLSGVMLVLTEALQAFRKKYSLSADQLVS